MDTIDSIIERIKQGEKLRMTVSGLGDKGFANWRAWFQELRRNIVGSNNSSNNKCVNCNSMISQAGEERLEVDIGVIPDGERQRVADELRLLHTRDSPKIALR